MIFYVYLFRRTKCFLFDTLYIAKGAYIMIEIAEAFVFAKQMTKELKGLTITDVKVLTTPHKFCWLSGEPEKYEEILLGLSVIEVKSSAHYLRIILSDGHELAIAEDVNLEYKPLHLKTDKHQLQLTFSNDYVLEFKVKLYGFIPLGTKEFLNNNFPYYKVAVDAIDPRDPMFTFDYFIKTTGIDLGKGSVKACLATEQHIPGLGNGTLQDILFDSKISPRRKVSSLSLHDQKTLYNSVIKKIDEMITFGGRDTVLSMFGEKGGYEVIMKNDREKCPLCQTPIVKEAFMGGKAIYCPKCQK